MIRKDEEEMPGLLDVRNKMKCREHDAAFWCALIGIVGGIL